VKRSLSLTLSVILGLMLFSIASCGSASDKKYAAKEKTGTEYSYDYEENLYDTYKTEEAAPSSFKAFPVYLDARSPDNHYVPSGYMGDHADINLNLACFDNPYSGTTCVKIIYNNSATQGARWGGMYWQNPANNWGDRKGGFDLTGATKISFWARGDKGGERIEEFKMGGVTGMYSDSDIAGIGPVLLTNDWKKYEIDLRGKDLSYISGGFGWSTNLDVNPDGVTFYLDDIRYE
jgi:hypothetical protein